MPDLITRCTVAAIWAGEVCPEPRPRPSPGAQTARGFVVFRPPAGDQQGGQGPGHNRAALLTCPEVVAMERMRVCAQPGCPTLTTTRRCPDHTRATEQGRGTRQQRGYGKAHDDLREHWRPKVERCEVDCQEPICLMPIRRILPGQAWHLCHDRETGQYRGPGHAKCNTSEGGKAAHAQ